MFSSFFRGTTQKMNSCAFVYFCGLWMSTSPGNWKRKFQNHLFIFFWPVLPPPPLLGVLCVRSCSKKTPNLGQNFWVRREFRRMNSQIRMNLRAFAPRMNSQIRMNLRAFAPQKVPSENILRTILLKRERGGWKRRAMNWVPRREHVREVSAPEIQHTGVDPTSHGCRGPRLSPHNLGPTLDRSEVIPLDSNLFLSADSFKFCRDFLETETKTFVWIEHRPRSFRILDRKRLGFS